MKKWFEWFSPRWDWLQVEVSSLCHADCIYCPTAIYPKDNGNRLMSMETFRKLSSSFPRTRLVYLQGWGEPFLNPNFFEMVRIAKAAGCQVGMTTNGMLMNAEKLTEVVNCGTDIVTFSLAGCSEKNDVIRKGTRLAQVLTVVKQLNQISEQGGKTPPEIHIAYMLLRSGLDEIDQLPQLLGGLGISQVVITTLDFVPSPALENETLVSSSQEEYDSLRARLNGVVSAGARLGIEIHYSLAAPQDDGMEAGKSNAGELDLLMAMTVSRPSCTENIQRAAFISAGGDVTPCVFGHLPVRTPEVAAAQTGKPYQFMVFGNVENQTLEAIWHSKNYRAFRRSHQSGEKNDLCQNCVKLRVQEV